MLVAVTPERLERLRAALGRDADEVSLVDMTQLGRNPARIIPAWRDFVDSHPQGAPLRGVGEPIWDGRRAAEIVECLARLDREARSTTRLGLHVGGG